MDFLNHSLGQVRELFLSMTPAARVTATLLLGVIGISITFLFQQSGSGPDDYLFGGEPLRQREVDRVMAAIATAGLQDAKQVGNRILVPHGQQSAYLNAVAKGDALPTNYDTIIAKSLEVGPFVDMNTRENLQKNAKERFIASILRDFESISEAQVIIDSSPSKGLLRPQVSTAMVTIQPASNQPINPQLVKTIQKTVAASVAGLQYQNVFVANQADGVQHGGAGTDISAESFESPYFQHRIKYERLMEDKISYLLRDIPGVQVNITAELDETISRTTHSLTPTAEGIATREISTDDELTNTKSENQGRPGLVAQGPRRTGDTSDQEKTTSRTTNSSRQTDNFVGNTQEKTEISGFIPQKVLAAIVIPSSYLEKVWRERNPEEPKEAFPDKTMLEHIENETVTKVKSLVTSHLPQQEKNPYELVNIQILETLTPDPIEGPSNTNLAMSWANQHMGTIMMGGLVLFSLAMLRSMVKSIPPADPVPDMGPSTLPFSRESDSSLAAAPDNPTVVESSDRARLQRFSKGPTLKDDLADIVREDTEAAAAILRTWISNAS